MGIYGGSFDPVHHGHLILARDALEQLCLDSVIFLPAKISPHKTHSPPADALTRIAMLQAAIANEPGFLLDDREIHRTGVSFAIDTVKELQKSYPDADFYYLIGEDNLLDLPAWKEIEILRQLVTFVLFSRNQGNDLEGEMPVIQRNIAISSTEIRKRIALGQSIRYFVPEMVHQILKKTQLYAR